VVRRRDDPAWPGPVWGHSPGVPYPDASSAKRLRLLREELGLQG
jgi:diadenosine tetraphosphate (Ap4A) HIT family hydrolase